MHLVVILAIDWPGSRTGDGNSVCDLRAQTLFLLAQFGGELVAEILGLEHLADFELRFALLERIGATLGPLDGFFERLALPQPETRDKFLGFGERTVDDGALVAKEGHARALRARMQALAGEHHTRVDQILVELAHRGQEFFAWHRAGFGLLCGLDYNHEAHVDSPA